MILTHSNNINVYYYTIDNYYRYYNYYDNADIHNYNYNDNN